MTLLKKNFIILNFLLFIFIFLFNFAHELIYLSFPVVAVGHSSPMTAVINTCDMEKRIDKAFTAMPVLTDIGLGI